MPVPSFNHQGALAHARQGADWAGLRFSSETTQHREVRNDKPDKNESCTEEGAMCEVLVDGTFGYAATADLSESGLKRAFDQAVATTRATSAFKVHQFSQDHRAPVRGDYHSPAQRRLAA